MAESERASDIARLLKANAELKRELDQTNQAMWALYKELDDKTVELRRSNEELDQFATIAGHDLQEPLRKVLVFGDRLEAEHGREFDARGREYLGRMQDASRRMLTLIDDLLRFARVTSEARPFEPTDLNCIAAGVLSDLEERIRKEHGHVEVRELPTIEADPTQMHQLLLNLVGNGLKFHHLEREPVVTVSASRAGERLAELAVADNGIGFDEKYADRIFQPFRRLHSRGAYDGTGMGLAICRKIALRHGGELRVTSHVDEGSTFLVTLPIKRQQAARAGAGTA